MSSNLFQQFQKYGKKGISDIQKIFRPTPKIKNPNNFSSNDVPSLLDDDLLPIKKKPRQTTSPGDSNKQEENFSGENLKNGKNQNLVNEFIKIFRKKEKDVVTSIEEIASGDIEITIGNVSDKNNNKNNVKNVDDKNEQNGFTYKITSLFKKKRIEPKSNSVKVSIIEKLDNLVTLPKNIRFAIFGVLLIIGIAAIVISLLLLSSLFVLSFSIMYSFGNVCILSSLFFLTGIGQQLKNLTQKHRFIPFVIYILLLVLTLGLSFYVRNSLLSLFLVIVQFICLVYYIITYFESSYRTFWWLFRYFVRTNSGTS